MEVVDVVLVMPFVKSCVVAPIFLYIFPKPFFFPFVYLKTLSIFGCWEPNQRIMELKPDPMISTSFHTLYVPAYPFYCWYEVVVVKGIFFSDLYCALFPPMPASL
jgi:hypothetical protein